MGSGGLGFDAADVVSASRLNQKTVFVGTGAQIAAVTPYQGQLAYCTSTGSGFITDSTYQYNGSSWALFGQNPTAQVADVYDTTIGDYTTPSSVVASSNNITVQNNGMNAAHGTGWAASQLWATKFTGLTVGSSVTKVGLNVSVAAGNVRVKVYQDDGASGAPSTLLGESNSIAVGGTGWQDFTLNSAATIPASGNVWAAFECDSASLDIYYSTTGGTQKTSITYGAGPNPFGTIANNNTSSFYCEITILPINNPALTIDNNTATEWKSVSEVNPYIYVDMGSALLLTAAALYWDGSSTTVTQILVQTSPDAVTWTTVRTINTNLFTNGAWNYFRWNLPNTALPRYVRFYGNDGGAKVLAIWEIKIKQYANTTTSAFSFMQVHGHPRISSSVATTPLNI